MRGKLSSQGQWRRADIGGYGSSSGDPHMQATCILNQQVPNYYIEKPLGILEDRSGSPTSRHVSNAGGANGVSFKDFLMTLKT